MVGKKYRIKRKKDFERLFEQGRSLYTKKIRIQFVKNSLNKSRFAFIVSLKVSKKATQRNTIRRRMSEIIRLNVDNIKKGYDIAFIARHEALGVKQEELKKSIMYLLKKNNLLL